MTSSLSNWLTGISKQRKMIEVLKATEIEEPSPQIELRPPSGSPSKRNKASHRSTKLVSFENYNISRPSLLDELERFISSRLIAIKDSDRLQHDRSRETNEGSFASQRLQVYREAFQRYIEGAQILYICCKGRKHDVCEVYCKRESLFLCPKLISFSYFIVYRMQYLSACFVCHKI